jgi:hypothetical protein
MSTGAHRAHSIIDFAPGVTNVVRRTRDKEYYAVETFHTSPFYNSITPILASDLTSRVDLLAVYGLSGIRASNDGVIMLNNHPLRRIKLVGMIAEYTIREFGAKGNKRGTDWYFLQLDDSSGVEVTVRVLESMLMSSGLSLDKISKVLVSVHGVCRLFNGNLELQSEDFEILDTGETDQLLREQLNFWKEVLVVRKKLQRNWVQVLQIDDDDDPTTYTKITISKPTRKLKMVNSTQLFDSSSESAQIESSIYIQKQRLRKQDSPPAVDDSSSSWTSLYDYKLPLSKLPFSHHLAIIILKWIMKNSQPVIKLNEPFQNVEINKILEHEAIELFPVQTISLPAFHIKSLNEIKGEIFHESRHELQKMKLIKCSNKGKICTCVNSLRFYELIIDLCESKESFKLDRLIDQFESLHKVKLEISQEFLEIMVVWIMKRSKVQDWMFYPSSKQWRVIS